jgi:hypothetical protein
MSGGTKEAAWVPLRGCKGSPEVRVFYKVSCKTMTPEIALRAAERDAAKVPAPLPAKQRCTASRPQPQAACLSPRNRRQEITGSAPPKRPLAQGTGRLAGTGSARPRSGATGGDASGEDATDMREYTREASSLAQAHPAPCCASPRAVRGGAQIGGALQAAASPDSAAEEEEAGQYGAAFLPAAGAASLDPAALERFSMVLSVRDLAGEAAKDATALLVAWGGRVHQIALGDAEEVPSEVVETLRADPEALVQALQRPAAQGGGLAVWLFAGRRPIGSGWAALDLTFADQAAMMGGAPVETEVAVPLLARAMPVELARDEAAAAAEEVAAVMLTVYIVGSGPGSARGDACAWDAVGCALHVTMVSLCETEGVLEAVGRAEEGGTLRLVCRDAGATLEGGATDTQLHCSEDIVLAGAGAAVGVGETMSVAGRWGDLEALVLEFVLLFQPDGDREEERVIGAGSLNLAHALRAAAVAHNVAQGAGALSLTAGLLPRLCGSALCASVELVDARSRSLARCVPPWPIPRLPSRFPFRNPAR